jgi:tRNA(Glu) U13 pseudouridine synthase TruD
MSFFFRNGARRIRIATITAVAIEIVKIKGIAIRMSATPIEAQMTTDPNAKSLRVHTMKTVITQATAITMAAHSSKGERQRGERMVMFEFSLPPGTYAIPVLREFMKADPSSY